MERKLTRTYNEARTGLTKEWQAFMRKQEPKVKDAYEDLQKALQTGNTQTVFDAKVYYQRVMMNTTIRNNRYKGMVNNLTSKIADVNKTALNYVNGNMANIYTINYNAFSDEDIKGYSFTLVNENAIRALMTTDKMLVPTKKLNVSKDRAWNAKFINSQVTQGIMQGENIQKIADRILPAINAKTDFTGKTKKEVSDLIRRNKNAAIRNARTMVTAAENKGRQDSYNKATSDGVLMDKEWMATGDGRTRDWHVELDGVVVGVDESWVNTYGEIEYPGDPGADPANVYNCRCSMRAHVRGFDWSKSIMKTIGYISIYEALVNDATTESTSLPLVQKNIQKGLDKVSSELDISIDDAEILLNSRLSDIVQSSDVGMAITQDNLLKALEDGKFKNVYETGSSTFTVNTRFRDEAEQMMFNMKKGLTKDADRPIYGALMPKLTDENRQYYIDGPIAKYGNGITVIFDKDKIAKSCTFSAGDSLNYAGRIGLSSLSAPQYAATYNIGATVNLANGSDLTQIADKLDHYFEVQLFGSDTHSINNISSVIIDKSKVDNIDELVNRLKEMNLNVEIIE